MEKILNFQIREKRLGLVYDLPCKLENSKGVEFPADATAEWESHETICFIADTWRALGFDVFLFPLDHTFLKMWSDHAQSCDLIHSLVEGFGSLSREAWIPSLCELSGIPFIGSLPFSHSVCMSKVQTKLICQYLEIPTAPFHLVKQMHEFDCIPRSFFEQNCFIKPDGEGSGMGIDESFSIVTSMQEAKETVSNLLEKYPDGILIESHLSGLEYTSALVGDPPQFLPIAQIEVETGVYGLSQKSKEKMGEKVTFPQLDQQTLQIIQQGTQKLSSHLQLHDFVRMDWKCDGRGHVYFLEANTLAGLSYYYSVLPLMAKQAGLDYVDLFKRIAESALKRTQSRNLWYGKTRVRTRPT